MLAVFLCALFLPSAARAQILKPIGELTATGSATDRVRSVVMGEQYAFVLQREGVLNVYDLSGLNESSSFYSNGDPVNTLAVAPAEAMEASGNFLYLAGNGSLSVYDVSIPAQPSESDVETEGLRNFRNLLVFDTYLLGLGEGGFSLYDISNPGNPAYVTSYSPQNNSFTTHSAAIVSPYLYVTETNPGGSSSLLIFDYAALPALSEIGQVGRDKLGLHLLPYGGDMLECGASHVSLIGLTDPLNPVELATRAASGASCDMVAGRLAANGLVVEVVQDQLNEVDTFDAGDALGEAIPYGSDASNMNVLLAQDRRVLILGDDTARPEVTLSQSQLQFGSVNVGASGENTLTVTSTGNADLLLQSVTIEGANAGLFSVTAGGDPATLAPGASVDITVTYGPALSGAHTAELVLTSNDVLSPHRVPLSGTGVEAILEIAPASLAFPATSVGAQQVAPLQLSNTGTAPLNLTSITIDAPGDAVFSIVEGGEPGSIGPGTSRTVSVAFAPAAETAYQGTLTITSDAGGSPHSIPLSGTGTVPGMTVSPVAIQYDDTQVGSSTDAEVTLQNTGSEAVSVTSVQLGGANASDFSIVSGGETGTIAAGQSRTVIIRFTPPSAGDFRALLTVEAGAPQSPFEVTLRGKGIVNELTISPMNLAFPDTPVSTEASSSITITNTGNVPLTMNALSIVQDGNAFQVDYNGEEVILPVGIGRDVIVQFIPPAPGNYTGELQISTTAHETPFSVSLSGTGIEPSVSINPSSLAFAETPVGAEITASVVIENTGNTPLTMETILLSQGGSAFRIASGGDAGEIAAGASREVIVAFNPPAAGPFAGQLQIATSAFETPFIVGLTGAGTETGVSINPSSLNFDDTPVGVETTASVAITNTGNVAVTMEAVTLSQDTNAFSILSGGDAGEIAAGASRDVVLAFNPPAAASYSGQLQVATSAFENPVFINLSGAGVEGILTTDRESIAFPVVALGQTSEISLTMTNVGAADLQIDRVEVSGTDAPAFTVISGGEAGTLAPGAARTLTVRFEPANPGGHHANLSVFDTAGLETIIPLTGSGTISFPDPVVEIPDEGEDVVIEVVTPESIALTETVLFYRRGGETEYQQLDMVAGASSVVGTIPGAYITLRGIDYYVRMSNGTDVFTYPTENYVESPAHLQVRVPPFTMPLEFQPERHAMISMPVELDDASSGAVLEDDYGDYDERTWRLHRWDASAASYAEYDGREPLEPGAAYWLVTRNGTPFDIENGLSVNTSTPQILTLLPGWNQIGTPFPFAVPWPDAITTAVPGDIDFLEAPVWYDGGDYAHNRSVLEPWTGYFVFNRKPAPIEMLVAPVEAEPLFAAKSSGAIQAADGREAEYSLRLSVSLPALGYKDADNRVGFREGALRGEDLWDRTEAPGFRDFVTLRVNEGDTLLAHSFRPMTDRGAMWEVEVVANINADLFRARQEAVVSLTPEGVLPESFDVYVLDLDAGQTLPVDEGSFTVELSSAEPTRRLRLIVGTAVFADAHRDDIPLKPVSYDLAQGYPNPFGDHTTIGYQVGKRQSVRIDVYDLLGRHVTTLVDAEKAAGAHEVVWDGRDAAGRQTASGVYVYRMRTEEFEATQKVVLLR